MADLFLVDNQSALLPLIDAQHILL